MEGGYRRKIQMRKRDRIKGYLPALCGSLSLWLTNTIVGLYNINIETYIVCVVSVWLAVTLAGIITLEYYIDMFDNKFNNENEEED